MKNLTIDFAIHRIVAFPRWIPWHLRMTMTMRMRWTGFGWTSWRRLQCRSGQWARRHRYHWMNGTYDKHRRRIRMQTKGDEMNWMLVNVGCIWCINFRWNVANMHTLHSVNSISFCQSLHTKWVMGYSLTAHCWARYVSFCSHRINSSLNKHSICTITYQISRIDVLIDLIFAVVNNMPLFIMTGHANDCMIDLSANR